MNKTLLTGALAICIMSMSSCKKSENISMYDGNAIKIGTTINDVVESRTTTDGARTTWGDGDQIKMYASKDTDQPAEMPGIAYTHNGGVWSPSNQTLFHKWESDMMHVGAHYPAGAGATLTSFILPADQTTSPKHMQADWLVAGVSSHIKDEKNTVNLSFNHKLAKVTVRINKYSDDVETPPASITSASIAQNIAVGDAVQLSEGGAVKMFCQADASYAKNHTMTAIVAPVAPKAGENWITITAEGLGEFQVKAPVGFTLEAGKHYALDLRVGKDKVALSNVTIVEWGTVDLGGGNLEAVPFNDPIFVAYLVQEHSISLTNGIIDPTDATTLEKLEAIISMEISDKGIKSLKGVEYMAALTNLHCYSNQLSTLDMSGNTALTSLNCNSNQLSTLDVSANTALMILSCSNNKLSTLDVSENTALKTLECSSNQLSTLDVSKNTALKTLYCSVNQLSTLDVSANTELGLLYCSSNQLSTLDVGKNIKLNDFRCQTNKLTQLDVSQNIILTILFCSTNSLTSINLRANISLDTFGCSHNQLSTLDVSANTALKNLYCSPMNDADNNNLLATLTYSVKPDGARWDVPEDTTQTQVTSPAVK